MSPSEEKFLYHLLLNVIRHAHVKFAPLDFIDKKIIGKRSKPNIAFLMTFVLLFNTWKLNKQVFEIFRNT